jgi:tetratricopeptide (TPR) repeat protein
MHRMMSDLLAAAAVLTLAPAARAESVQYRDRTSRDGKPKTVVGTITADTVTGLTLRTATGGEVKIPAGDVLDITFDLGGKNLPYQQAQQAERRSAAEGIAQYTALLPQLDARTPAARHLQYRVAMLRAQLAEESAGRGEEEYKARLTEAITALKKFKADHPNCWQLTPAVRELANLHLDAGDTKAALATVEELAGNTDLGPELREEAELQVVDLLLRAKDYKAADLRVGRLMSRLPAGAPAKARLEVIQTGCQALLDPNKLPEVAAKLQAVIEDKGREPYLKALAYNVLGDCYQAAGQKREALWSYLWVDVIYNQDKQEHVKALDRLVRLFAELKDEGRSKYYEDRLRRTR